MSAGPHSAAFASSRRVSQINTVTGAQELREHVALSYWASFAETSFFQPHLNTLHDFKYNDFSVKNKLCSRNN